MSWDDFADPDGFKPGDKVWFCGTKAKVVEGFDDVRKLHPFWAVPIMVGKKYNPYGYVTVAHSDHLVRRG